MSFLNDLEHEISSAQPPRQVVFRSFQNGRKAWLLLIIANFICVLLFVLLISWSIPFWAANFGNHAYGKIVKREWNNNNQYFLISYESNDSKTHEAQLSVNAKIFNGFSENQSMGIYYLTWLTSRPTYDSDWEKQTFPEVFGPFILLGYLAFYGIGFFSLWKEFYLFKFGVLAKGVIREQTYGKHPVATVMFTYNKEEYLKQESYSGPAGEPAIVLVNPEKLKSNKVYFQNASSIFRVS
jgi:hypothetical protein